MGLLLAALALVAGLITYLITGSTLSIVVAAIGLVTVVSGYVMGLGRR